MSGQILASWRASITLLLMAMAAPAFAVQPGIEPLKCVAVHEAYMTKVTGADVLQAVPYQPPADILERIPHQSDDELVWIPGYWQWFDERADFIWISGVWRRPPPDHQWVSGHWLDTEQGPVWIRGFWTTQSEDTVEFLSKAPPDQPTERIDQPRNPDYFWAPGYWHWHASKNHYMWYEGSWERLDPNWVLVPAHYAWRPEGWVFIPAFWDWTIEDRGYLYSPVWIDPSIRDGVEYLPSVIVDQWACVHRLYVYYPDYSCFFYHHCHYHWDWWDSCGCVPPWWSHPDWWCFSWHDHWALWWWYCHPGYPQPFWMTAALAKNIAPPKAIILNDLKNIKGPAIITPKGVVTPDTLLNILGDKPILPPKGEGLDKINQDLTGKIKLPPTVIRPLGKPGAGGGLGKPSVLNTPPKLSEDQLGKAELPDINLLPKLDKAVEPERPVIRLPNRPPRFDQDSYNHGQRHPRRPHWPRHPDRDRNNNDNGNNHQNDNNNMDNGHHPGGHRPGGHRPGGRWPKFPTDQWGDQDSQENNDNNKPNYPSERNPNWRPGGQWQGQHGRRPGGLMRQDSGDQGGDDHQQGKQQQDDQSRFRYHR
ncbi:MAG: hypothetical protein Q8K75_07115 [Chlamydiales bacterium]|nr:hypothetical protein [Chlamydiales bacterium]